MSEHIKIADLGDTLCEFCSWKDESHSIGSLCDGAYCEQAYENYIDYIENLEEE